MEEKCSRCGSEKLVRDMFLGIRDDGRLEQIFIRIENNPEAWFKKDSREDFFKATTCADCGHIELRMPVRNARAMWNHQNKK